MFKITVRILTTQVSCKLNYEKIFTDRKLYVNRNNYNGNNIFSLFEVF